MSDEFHFAFCYRWNVICLSRGILGKNKQQYPRNNNLYSAVSYFSRNEMVGNTVCFRDLFYCISNTVLKGCDLLRMTHIFEHEPWWFCKQSFFIYSAHFFLVEGLCSILARVSSSMLWVSLSYMINPIISLALLYIASKVLTQRFPKLYGLLCGNRI